MGKLAIAAAIVSAGILILGLGLPLAITDIMLGKNRACDGDCGACQVNFRTPLIVRGSLHIAVLGLITLSVIFIAVPKISISLIVLTTLTSLAAFGYGIYILVISYQASGLKCIDYDKTIWLYIHIVQWIYFGAFSHGHHIISMGNNNEDE